MDDRLRAAVANYRAKTTRRPIADGMKTDVDILADAFIASIDEAAGDCEPITIDFINQHFANMGPQYSAKQHCSLSQLVWLSRFERLTLWDNPLPQIKTRGQLRRLVNLLKGD